MTRFVRLALVGALLTLAAPAAVSAQTPAPVAVKVETAIKVQEKIATDAFFPPANTIAEIAKGIRAEVYSTDLTPAQMLEVLDRVAATPLSRFGLAAVAQIRKEIEAG